MSGAAAGPRPPAGTAQVGRAGRIAVVLWLAALALGAWLAARAHYSADMSAFLPASPDAAQRVLIEQLQSGHAARTLLIGIEGGDAVQRAAASRTLAKALRDSGRFVQVVNGEQDAWRSAGEFLFAHRYQLSPAVTPERFTPAGLADAIDETVSLLGTPAGSLVKPILERDPTGETQRVAELLIPSQAPRSDEGVWASRKAPRAVLLAGLRAAGGDFDAQQAAIELVRERFAADRAAAAAGLRLQLSGAPVFAVTSRSQIEREVKWLTITGSVVMGALLLLAFASWRALAVAALPVATGVLAGIVAVSLGFGTVHGLTLGFGSTLIGESVDYAIYYLIQARGAAQRTPGVAGQGWCAWRDASWPTVRLGLFTSVCGFAALVFSGFPGLAQLGVFSIAGLVAAALTARFVLPVWMPDGAAGQGARRQLARVAAALLRHAPRARPLVWLAGGATLLSIALALAVRDGGLWRGDLLSLSPVPRAALALDAELREDLAASDARTLVVASGTDRETALRAAEAAGARLDTLVAEGVLAGYDSPARLLPSQATQAARLAALPDAATLRRALDEATAGGPLKAARLGPFVEAVEQARGQRPFERAALGDGALGAVVDALLIERPGGGWAALIALQPGPAELDAARLATALQGLPGLQVVDIKRELDALYARYLGDALWQSALGALAVVLLLAAALRSPRRLLAVCQPLAWAVLLTLGILVVLDVALGILHLVGLLLVVAVGSNYALFFDQQSVPGAAPLDDDTLASLLLANLTTVASFGLIALSQIPALSAIGRVVAPGALLALMLAAAFVPVRAPAAPADPVAVP